MKPNTKLVTHAPMGPGSWAHFGAWLHQAMVRLSPQFVAPMFGPRSKDMTTPERREDVHLVCGPLSFVVGMLESLPPGALAIAYTTHETTLMSWDWAQKLAKAKAVLVASKFAQVVFAASARIPTRIVRHGVHEAFVKEPLGPLRVGYEGMRIGAGGAWRGAGERKRILDLADAFVKWAANGQFHSWRLSLRVPDLPDWAATHTSPVLEWAVGRNLSPKDQVRWYDSLAGYMTLSMGEGFDLMTAEAIARGLPVAGPAWGGTGEHPLTVRMGYELKPFVDAGHLYPENSLGAWVSEEECNQATERFLASIMGMRGTRCLPVDGVRTVDDCALEILGIVKEVQSCPW